MVAMVLVMPKICALIDLLPKARTRHRCWITLKASLAEPVIAALIAPLILMHHVFSVLSIVMGQDCGWKSKRTQRWSLPDGGMEVCVALTFIGGVVWLDIATAP